MTEKETIVAVMQDIADAIMATVPQSSTEEE